MQGINTQISDDLKRTLKKGDIAVYRVLGMRKVTDSNGNTKMNMPASVYFPSIDTISDPGNNDELVEIKCLLSSTPQRTQDGTSKVNEKYIDLTFDGSSNGLMILRGGNNKHQRMYQFMEICNRNKSNPNRDVSVRAIFEKVDAKADNKKKLEDAAAISKAENIALTAEPSVIKILAERFNLSPSLETEDLRLALMVKAKKEPAKFIMNTAPDPHAVVKGHLEKGMEAGEIAFEENSNEWKFKQYDPSKKWKRAILSVPIGQNTTNVILEHFASKDGQADLDRLLFYLEEEE